MQTKEKNGKRRRMESMTGKLDTNISLHAALELYKEGCVRVKYSPKVDLYSLGIIFFENCFRPLTSNLERLQAIGNQRMAKNGKGFF